MSMDPTMMAQMLASSMGGGAQQPMQGQAPTVSPLGAGADLARKAMLINALRQQVPQRPIAQANPALQQL